MESPLVSARIITDHFCVMAFSLQLVLSYVQPVDGAPAVAAAITSALANVARTVAAAPEESMAAIADLYASYAERAAHIITSGIVDAQSLANESVRRTRNAL